jgi:hypothetical protein
LPPVYLCDVSKSELEEANLGQLQTNVRETVDFASRGGDLELVVQVQQWEPAPQSKRNVNGSVDGVVIYRSEIDYIFEREIDARAGGLRVVLRVC